MTSTKEIVEISQTQLLKRLSLLYKNLKHKDDVTNAIKIEQLIDKVDEQEFAIAFCGHFSAGKSSMINHLIGDDLLPSSPIPTSANLVKVKSGQPYARVYFNEGNPVEFEYPYDISKVKRYCVNGDEVSAVEISHPTDELPSNVAIMDTPGVDSTDDAHRVSTESSLHLADVIFYVMDYNHVQAESNFQFTKMLQQYKKPLYFIVNQIDKHNEEELSFTHFQQSVAKGFANWDVHPERIFYTSLKDATHPHNELNDLKLCLERYMDEKENMLFDHVLKTSEVIIGDSYDYEKSNVSTKIQQLKETIDDHKEVDLIEQKSTYESEIKKLQQQPIFAEENFKSELMQVLSNAILMPYDTRELAKSYIESCQKGFKVGMLFAKNKTIEERKRRLEAFHANLSEKISANIDWAIKELLIKFTSNYQFKDEQFSQAVHESKFEFPVGDVEKLVKPGATLNGQYVLTYTEDVASEVKKKYRVHALQLFHIWLDAFSNKNSLHINHIENQCMNVQTKINAFKELKEIDQTLIAHKEQLETILHNENSDEVAIHHVEKTFKRMSTDDIENVEENYATRTIIDVSNEELINPTESKIQMEQTSNNINEIASLIDGIPGLQLVQKQLKERAERLKNNRFTIALFGAFSAGKSSFANAFIGEKVLPVSPNPTTATINKISPIDEEHPHGTIIADVKNVEEMLLDIRQSLQIFNLDAESIEQALKLIDTLKPEETAENAKPHYTFLKAFARGYSFMEHHLGTKMSIDRTLYESFVAEEDKACFIESIEVFYDCALTQQGITLVDTPGADSINARHTGVAFNYIKNADAILFVTYYNHAFNHADREFLIQLGRVKDAFELDKMFFIVNASDLAKDDEELEIVLSHVQDNLTSCGIRNPRLYPISSKEALVEKQTNKQLNSGMNVFEQQFMKFSVNDLILNATNAAWSDVVKADKIVNELIDTAQVSQTERETRKAQLLSNVSIVGAEIANRKTSLAEKALKNEIEELLYYVKKRVQFRYNEGFKYAFNPSNLSDDGRNMKEALTYALDELLQFMSYDLAQELRATTLRIEKQIRVQLNDMFEKDDLVVKKYKLGTNIQGYNIDTFFSPEINEKLQVDEKQFRKSLSIFKNPRQFFEQNGSQQLKEKLEHLLDEPISLYIEKEIASFIEFYVSELQKHRSGFVKYSLDTMEDYKKGQLAALSSDLDINHMKEVSKKIQAQLPS